jgi:type IV pilus assembly protein PilM
MPPSLSLSLGRRSTADVVGLDIQPGLVVAVQARVNGALLAERAAALELPADAVREGDVVDARVLSDTLRELYAGSHLSKRVRVGVANQRTVMRTLELPALTDSKELAAAVKFQAQDQVPMPLANAVLDFHPLGIVDTPAGRRQKVVLVAAQRDMVERLLAAVRGAGLTPVGVDMSAFALIRSLYRSDADHADRVLYLNVDGLTNVAIAEGTLCRFTRVLGGGIEAIAAELAERRGIPLAIARELLADVDLTATPAAEIDLPPAAESAESAGEDAVPAGASAERGPAESDPAAAAERPEAPWATEAVGAAEAPEDVGEPTAGEHAARERETLSQEPTPPPEAATDEDARAALEGGIRAIAGEVRNSLEFHRSQEGGGDVSRVVLSGSALELPGFAEALQASLGVDVHGETVGLTDDSQLDRVSVHRLAVATGLAATEVPQ